MVLLRMTDGSAQDDVSKVPLNSGKSPRIIWFFLKRWKESAE